MSFGYLDLSWHGKDSPSISTVKEHEKQTMSPFQFTQDIPENCMSTSFSHIFQGGYSAGYYSYKWSEVLDADAFSRFSNEPDNSEVAQDFKKLLKAGGSIDPLVLFKNFMGREPNINALLTRAGLDE